MRTFAQADVDALAQAASMPVINALTDDHHPCEALADMLTLRDHFGPLDGLRIAYVGDGNNVAHSLIEAASLLGMEIAVATPTGYEPDAALVRAAQLAGRERAGRIHCLPAHRGDEVAGEVIDGAASVVWEQAADRLPIVQALLYALITGSWDTGAC